MFERIRNLFGANPVMDFTQLIRNGATILDVRTKAEFETGHIPGAINIPLDRLSKNLGTLTDKNKPIITCCASGMRSATAEQLLTSKGFINVFNGGGWVNLMHKL